MIANPKSDAEAPAMRVMRLVSEVPARFPDAISFAGGIPASRFTDASNGQAWLERYVDHRAAAGRGSVAELWSAIGQYSATRGIIGDLVAEHLRRTERLDVEERAILVTNGIQEALLLLLLGAMDPSRDAVLTAEPTYFGLTGAAAIARVPVFPVTGDAPFGEAIETAISAARAQGRRPRAIYLVPDFSNPTGRSLSLAERLRVIEIAHANEMWILEDTAYRAFAFDEPPPPTIAALDGMRATIYLGSFSKTFLPGLRVGFLVAPRSTSLGEDLAKVKGYTTIAPGTLAQAMVGGFLLEQEFRLESYNRERVAHCKRSLDWMVACLDRTMGSDPALSGRVSWSTPSGGFFLPVSLPFRFGEDELLRCARDCGVVALPMSFFALTRRFDHMVRLSFSAPPPAAIEEGVRRLARFVSREAARGPRRNRSEPRRSAASL